MGKYKITTILISLEKNSENKQTTAGSKWKRLLQGIATMEI